MSWIQTISYEDADASLKKIYDRVKGPDDNIDNVLMIHSLRPHTLTGHMTLYKNVLHHSGNTLPKWYLESIGVYVSYLNQCDYCVKHHFEGYRKLIRDEEKAQSLLGAIEKNDFQDLFSDQYTAGLLYAKQLTKAHTTITDKNIDHLRKVGFDDGEILEINQVSAYFNYVNRMVVGLGVSTDGDILGLSPNNNDDPELWSHQ